MKRSILLMIFLAVALTVSSQTVENIRVVQDGENLKITYRIGASTESQLYNVFLTCSMDGGKRFEPKAVMGDVGQNIIGGKSYYTIIWDVFADVEEVVNPEFFVRLEMTSDMAAVIPPAATRQTTTQTQTQPQQQPEQKPATQERPAESASKTAETGSDEFKRNGFFSYNAIFGLTPFGISFGSLNNWGYYVTVLRFGWSSEDRYDPVWGYYVSDTYVDLMTSAGATKHFVSAGFYRLHGYLGIGGHLSVDSYGDGEEVYSDPYFMLETGIVNVLGPVNVTVGLAYSIGYSYPVNLVLGVGFVF